MTDIDLVYVYRCRCCLRYWCARSGRPLRCPECGSKDRTHKADVDPVVTLARVLNGDPGVMRELKGEPDAPETEPAP